MPLAPPSPASSGRTTASSPAYLCSGYTLKNLPCQRRVRRKGEYCHHHQSDLLPELMSSLSIIQSTHKTTKCTPGYIYVYTLTSTSAATVYNGESFVPIDQLRSRERRSLMRRLFFNTNRDSKDGYMLVKVGFTRKTPAKRLQEWSSKCNQPIALIYPKKPHLSNTFDSDKRGWLTADPHQVETSIHSELRGLLGSGYVVCQGCSKSNTPKKHYEWFLIKRSNQKLLFDTIEYWTGLYRVRGDEYFN